MIITSILYCEVLKVIRSKVFWLSFVIFSISLAILSLGIQERSWVVFFNDFLRLTGNMMMLVNFFIASWIFGREFTDKTHKDLVAKPISRGTVVMSKFIIIFLWGILFMLFLFTISLVIGLFLGFTGFSTVLLFQALPKFIATSLLYIFVSLPGSFFASISKGILAPIGALFIIALSSNIINESVIASYFPWTIPLNLFLETGRHNLIGLVILFVTSMAGIIGTLAWWRFAEQE